MGIKVFDLVTLMENLTGKELWFRVRDPTTIGSSGICFGVCPICDLPRGKSGTVKLRRIVNKKEKYCWTVSVYVNGIYTGIEIHPWDIITHVLIVFRYLQNGDEEEVLCVEGVKENRSTDYFFRHRGVAFRRKKSWGRRSKLTIARDDSHMSKKLRDAEATFNQPAESSTTLPVLQGETLAPVENETDNLSPIIGDGMEGDVSVHLQGNDLNLPQSDHDETEASISHELSDQDTEAATSQSPEVTPTATTPFTLRQSPVEVVHNYTQKATEKEGNAILQTKQFMNRIKVKEIGRLTWDEKGMASPPLSNIWEPELLTPFIRYQISADQTSGIIKRLFSYASTVTGAKGENLRKKLMLMIRSRVRKSRNDGEQLPHPQPSDWTFGDGFVYGAMFTSVLVFVSYYYINWG